MPLIWTLVAKALAAGRKVHFRAVHVGSAQDQFAPYITGEVTEVREDGYIVNGSFMASFPEDDEWKTIKRQPDGTLIVCNKPK